MIFRLGARGAFRSQKGYFLPPALARRIKAIGMKFQ